MKTEETKNRKTYCIFLSLGINLMVDYIGRTAAVRNVMSSENVLGRTERLILSNLENRITPLLLWRDLRGTKGTPKHRRLDFKHLPAPPPSSASLEFQTSIIITKCHFIFLDYIISSILFLILPTRIIIYII